MGKTYTINKISDILQIPEDGLEDFLIDLKAYYSVGKNMITLLGTAGDVLGVDVETALGAMHWTDDGKHDAAVSITTKGTEQEK